MILDWNCLVLTAFNQRYLSLPTQVKFSAEVVRKFVINISKFVEVYRRTTPLNQLLKLILNLH